MMNKLDLHNHGEVRLQKIKINHGKTEYFRREKFCAEHGWIDLFFIGGDLEWMRRHGKCGDQPRETGAALELPDEEPKMMTAAGVSR